MPIPLLRQVIGITAGVIVLVAYLPYNLAMIQGKTRANRASWWIWTVLGVILGAGTYAAGARAAIWVPVSFIIGPLVTAIVALRYGEGGWTPFDRACLLGSAASLVLWRLSNSPLWALILNIVIDVLGALPTIKKSISRPESENRLTWTTFFFANSLNLLAVESWTLLAVLYPLYLCVMTGLFSVLLWRPHIRMTTPD
jgi:hypothetical protein